MTRAEARRRRRIKRKAQQIAAWTVLILAELVISALPAVVTAAIVLPIVYRERGYLAYGSEWFLIAIVFCAAYSTIHNKVCDRIFEEV